MLSSEARTVRKFVVAFAAGAAGAALVWLPLSAARLPFRDTSTYSVWVFLIATICGSCPLVWSHGRSALARLPTDRPIKELIRYVLLAAIFTLMSLVAGSLVYLRGGDSVVTLPYLQARLLIVYAAGLLAVSPSIMAMLRVGDAARQGNVLASDLIAWRAVLQSQLTALGAVIALSTLTTASLGTAVHAAYPHSRYSVGGVLVFGAWFTGLLAIIYFPPAGQLRRRAQMLVDGKFPIPDKFEGNWQEQLQRRRDLISLLRIDETNPIQNALIIIGPLITSALPLLIPPQ